jgi:DNA-binding NarL/FixJ family response regulator
MDAHTLRERPALVHRGANPYGEYRDRNVRSQDASGLTPREIEVLRLLAAGCTTREVAALLVISAGTVERHITQLYAKIGARCRADATRYAVRAGLEGDTQ